MHYPCIYLTTAQKSCCQDDISLSPAHLLFSSLPVLYFFFKLFWPQYLSYAFEYAICSTFQNSHFHDCST
jgi:hypothetical protein